MKFTIGQRLQAVVSVSTIALSVALGGCGKIVSSSAVTTTDPLEGEWLTDCLNHGAGLVSKIYVNVIDGKSYLAYLRYAGAGCTGSYTLETNPNGGTPITEAQHTNSFVDLGVSGVPDHYRVSRSVAYSNGAPTGSFYDMVIYYDDSSFSEIFSPSNNVFASVYTTWDGWLTETDVAGFVAASTKSTYTPVGALYVLTFNKGGLP